MTLVNIQATDVVKDSRATINSNFSYLDGRITSEVATINSAITDLDITKAEDNVVVRITGVQTIAGVKTFSSFPVTPSSAPTTDYQVANKKYVDDAAFAGVSDASETVKGVVEEATDAEVAAGTAVGATGAKLFITPAKAKTFADNKAKVRAHLASGVSVSSATKLPFGNKDFDIGSNFTSGTFTAPRTGYYHITIKATSQDAGGNATPLQTFIYKNGSSISALASNNENISGGGGHCFSELVALTASDTIEIYASAPAASTIVLSGTRETVLTIFEL